MVRIIEIPSNSAADLPSLRAKRREIIHKISVRSNLQNPIRRWNLVSNDDFQNELSQYFWKKQFYYERRQREWKQRKDDLQSIGIRQDPGIRALTQMISSYNYNYSDLGPANAQGQLNELFDEESYSKIRSTQPELAYRLFLLSDVMFYFLRRLKKKRGYIYNVSGYVKFALFSVLCRSIKKLDPGAWKKDSFGEFLEAQYQLPDTKWENLIKSSIDYILDFYEKAQRQAENEGWYLTPANFFKTKSYIAPILSAPLPKKVVRLSREIIRY